MEKKTIFIDCDDTLIVHGEKESYIPDSAYTAMDQLQQNGHRIALSSGRSDFQVEMLMKELKVNNAVCFNGHMVLAENKIIFDSPIISDELQPVINDLLEINKTIYAVNSEYIYSNDPTGRIRMFIRDKMRPGHANCEETFEKHIRQIDNIPREYYFFMVFDCELNKYLSQKPNSKIDIKHWSNNVFEILNKNISKFSGIEHLINHYNEDIRSTVAFGDSYNDIEMIKGVAYGVAMGNSPQALKDVANLVTDKVENNGFYNACKKLKLI